MRRALYGVFQCRHLPPHCHSSTATGARSSPPTFCRRNETTLGLTLSSSCQARRTSASSLARTSVRLPISCSHCGPATSGLTVGLSLNRHQLDRAWWECLGWELCRVEQFCHGGCADLDMWMRGKVKGSSVERIEVLWNVIKFCGTGTNCPGLNKCGNVH